MINIGLDEHRGIMLEALRDYRRWFEENPDPADTDMVKKIDKAIHYLRGAE